MLSIQTSSNHPHLTPNILPCKIHHNGPLRTSKTHWNPQTTSTTIDSNKPQAQNDEQTAYLRGRKLRGKKVKLPEGYEGVILQKTEKRLPQMKPQDDEEDEEEPVEVRLMEQKGTFDEIIVWGHEMVPDEEDVYRKGIEEWVGFAEAVSR